MNEQYIKFTVPYTVLITNATDLMHHMCNFESKAMGGFFIILIKSVVYATSNHFNNIFLLENVVSNRDQYNDIIFKILCNKQSHYFCFEQSPSSMKKLCHEIY